uniref:LLM class flavin-dependent oxidoreductase n=1 Tax=Cronobacter dublinensis TaxID=413497 RepID=UPI0018F8A253
MRLAVNLVHQGAGELARAAERLGYAAALAPEGYRSDAASVLGLVAGVTERIASLGKKRKNIGEEGALLDENSSYRK